MKPSGPFYRFAGEAVILTVRVQPGARADTVMGVADGALRIRLAAPAQEGRANEALREFLAARLGTAKSRVEIIKGQTGRLKLVKVLGARLSPESLFP
ncbi:MAG TPA: DUF167 domain-containing protein [Gammaproteobacteria bacterium]|nr:DUF167 domain-containing protein [Gammaproteobacteria bacterium]HEV2332003.1 DUF167 domain-containing protein [Gammaproteobacteria bacterium]